MIKTYEFQGYILEYEVEKGRNTTVFTDHTGSEVPINHLWFYDPEMIEAIFGVVEGVQVGHVVRWFIENKEGLQATRVAKNSLKTWFGEQNPFTCPHLDLYTDSEFGIFTAYTTSVTPSFFFNDTEEEESKPIFQVKEYESFGRFNRKSKGSNKFHVEEDQWNRHWNYTHKMEADSYNFFRKTKKDTPFSPQYGLELEVNTRLSSFEIQYIVEEVEPKQEPFFIFKQDSSISGQYDNYYELVTVPCSYRYHRKAWSTFFGKLEKLCAKKGVRLEDVFDCSTNLSNGLHIHVSKDSFYSQTHERKFMTIFNQWDSTTVNFLQKISGRPSSYKDNHYCSTNPEYYGKTLAQRMKLRSSSGRYLVHNQNPNTIEVRLFQGIFDLKHVLACLDFTDAMLNFSLDVPYSGINMHIKQRFFEFLGKANNYRTLKEVI